MKKTILLLAAIIIGYMVNAQTVENIRVEPDGENIKINFRIGGSTEAQLYNVTITCSMDGGPRFEPKTVIGDVGKNIRGGRAYYTVVWDVFEDVAEVNNAEFFVKVDLVSDLSQTRSQPQYQPQTQPQFQPAPQKEQQTSPTFQDYPDIKPQKKIIEKKRYFAYSGSTQSPLGISFGNIKNFGGYFSMRYGSDISDWYTDIWITMVTGFTKYIWQSGIYRLDGYIGGGITVEHFEESVYDTDLTDYYFTFDFGLINSIGKLDLNIGLEYTAYPLEDYQKVYPVFGIGFFF
jgi:hypothetical protein